jgi:hypothetical protein
MLIKLVKVGRRKKEILSQLKVMDILSDQQEADQEHWKNRYAMKEELEQILHKEEIYRQQRGRENWILKGDANTAFFHSVANGRRRKTKIC